MACTYLLRSGAADTAHERDPSGTQPPQPRSVGIAPQPAAATFSPQAAGESHLANKRLFCCGKSILGVLR
ncbi:hypothetical protein EBB04_15080 [Sinorhizobium meliloti]|nr:hypothetical protein EBB04_15080 [Sinorhizobium meliloti]